MKRAALAIGLGALLAACGRETPQGPIALGGNGSETTNGFTLLVINQDGTPASAVLVHIRPSDSMAGRWGDSLVGALRTRLDTVSDAEGHVNIDGLVRGNYTVELRQGDIRRLAHQAALPERPYGGQFTLSQAGTPRFTDIRLAGCELTLFGIDRKATANAAGAIQFDSLPVGNYSFRAWKNGKRLGDGTFSAQTGTSAKLLSFDYAGSQSDPTSFRNASAIAINGSVSHADVRSTFAGFPIPLDLSQENFEFAGASPMALRFVSASGHSLPYEIENWDSTTRKARLWLRLDTLLALTDNQMIQMYWGGSVQPSLGPIFDTADSWWGIWHLRQTLKDVTQHQRSAIGSQAGVNGWYSNGTNTLNFPGLPDQTDSGFTVSLWILPDTGQRASAPILRQIPSDASASPFSLRMGPFSTWIEAHYPNGEGAQVAQFPSVSAPGEWLHIAVTYNRVRDEMRLFLNGKPWGDAATALNATGLKMNGTLLLGGSDSAGIGFKGLVKEVRLSTKPRSEDWISAEYNFLNTKNNFDAVVFQRLR